MVPEALEVLSLEPLMRDCHGLQGLHKFQAPYTDMSALEQITILSFLHATGVTVPANDLYLFEDGWYY